MTTEQDKTLAGLRLAIRMEIDGKRFYLKASEGSSNELGRKLLHKLAAEEDIHRRNFETIYEAISDKRGWPETDFVTDKGRSLRTIFAEANEKMVTEVKAATTELDAIKTAMDMENKSYDLYKSQSKEATSDAQRDFFDAVAAEERQHHLILLDYYEYIKDPAAWFAGKEHPSLDGG